MIIGDIRNVLIDELERELSLEGVKLSPPLEEPILGAALRWFESNALTWAQARIDGLVEEDKKAYR